MGLVLNPYQDAITTSSSSGATGTSGIGGIGNREVEYDLSSNQAEAAVLTTIAGSFGGWAEVWQSALVPPRFLLSRDALITVSGEFAAQILTAMGNASLSLTVFIRDYNGIKDERTIVSESGGIFDYWSENDTYEETLVSTIESGVPVQIGIAVQVSAQALTASGSSAVVHTNDQTFEYAGFLNYDEISIEWL